MAGFNKEDGWTDEEKVDEELSEPLILPTGRVHIFHASRFVCVCVSLLSATLLANMISAPGLLVRQPSDVPHIRMSLTKHFTLLSFPSFILHLSV